MVLIFKFDPKFPFMSCGICLLSIIPVRREPSERSEMVNQLLFGDLVTVNRSEGNWLQISGDQDGYPGWVDLKQIRIINNDESARLKNLNERVTSDLIQKVLNVTDGYVLHVPAGSSLRGIRNGRFEIDGLSFSYSGNMVDGKAKTEPMSVISYARLFLNAPYQWGGRGPLGIDCSGLVQVAFKMAGIPLLRDASQQATQGQPVGFLEEALPGDLVFFDNAEGAIVHVGILTEPGRILHASGKVRIDRVDHQGIYSMETATYTHKLRLIRRMI
jgi:gamma-D-glutamyl-L-lysine dipeptidyl-peptidase